jgi:DNA-binding transcriptional LysR family regulator
VDPHLLQTFVTVARLGSFSAAATELGYTQAAISQQMAALESDLKVTLLNRRPVAPTEAGARLLEHAGPILLRLDAARADLARMTQSPSASLVVGMTPLAGGLPAFAGALAALRARLPRVAITVRVGPRPDVATGVARGELDVGLIDGLAAAGDSLSLLAHAPLSAMGVAESEVGVVMPKDHPLAHRAAIPLADFVDARWIDAPDVAPLSEIRRMARTDGFRPAFSYEGTDTVSLIALAAAGHGLTLLPTALAALAGVGDFALVRVAEPRIVHQVELFHGTLRHGSPAAELAALL